jgi:Zn-dependent protease
MNVGTLNYERQRPKDDPLPVAVGKTVGSMVVSAIVYYFFLFHNVTIAVGFVVLMLVHELGHVIAMKWKGISASPPIFIPFLGALINMRETPKNALVESIVGIGGPLLGTVGALACYALAVHTVDPVWQLDLHRSAQLGFMLNLFNLLPVPPLDGGRITAAISLWLWIPGLLGLGYLMLVQTLAGGMVGLVILVMLLVYALPRIRQTLQLKGRQHPYYKVSRAASWTMGALYFGLGAVLFYMFRAGGGFEVFRG